MELMLDNILGFVVGISIVVFIIFVICLSMFVYLSEDRKILTTDLKKAEDNYNKLFDKYFKTTISNATLNIKNDLLEKYFTLESSEENE